MAPASSGRKCVFGIPSVRKYYTDSWHLPLAPNGRQRRTAISGVGYSEAMQIILVVGGAVVGAIAHVGSQELWQTLKARRLGPDRSGSMLGEWSGTWWLGDDETAQPYVQADIIKISDARNRQVHGEGRDEKGTYVIEGHVSEHGIVSMFYGYRKMSLNGVCILQPSPQADKYHGRWYGYIKEGRIDGGSVVWNRIYG